MSRRVVITGMGAISPLGNSVESFWRNLKQGKHGIGPISHFDATETGIHVAAEVKNFDPAAYMNRKEYKRMDVYSQYGIAASQEAVLDAKFDWEHIDKARFGVYFGTGIGGIQEIEKGILRMQKKGPKRVNPLFVPMAISNMGAANISMHFGLQGPALTLVTACASANNAIGEAFRAIKDGYMDYALAGGGESAINEIGIAGFANLTALNTTTDPNRASIPFDKERTGFVMGEGAGVLVLESYDAAVARGAKIYAEISGYGATSDAYHLTAPHKDGKGAVKAMQLAMQEAGVLSEQVDYINAHGTSTPANDSSETAAIKATFGEVKGKTIPVSSTKSAVGHLLGAAGVIEAIASVKAMTDSFIPGNLNYQVPDEACDLNIVPPMGKEQAVDVVLSNTLGFGGHNTVLCFKKVKE